MLRQIASETEKRCPGRGESSAEDTEAARGYTLFIYVQEILPAAPIIQAASMVREGTSLGDSETGKSEFGDSEIGYHCCSVHPTGRYHHRRPRHPVHRIAANPETLLYGHPDQHAATMRSSFRTSEWRCIWEKDGRWPPTGCTDGGRPTARHWYWRAYGGDIAIRKWWGKAAGEKPLTGHHIGIYGQIFTYDFETGGRGYMGGKPGGTLWDKMNYIVGAEYGYSLPIARG